MLLDICILSYNIMPCWGKVYIMIRCKVNWIYKASKSQHLQTTIKVKLDTGRRIDALICNSLGKELHHNKIQSEPSINNIYIACHHPHKQTVQVIFQLLGKWIKTHFLIWLMIWQKCQGKFYNSLKGKGSYFKMCIRLYCQKIT